MLTIIFLDCWRLSRGCHVHTQYHFNDIRLRIDPLDREYGAEKRLHHHRGPHHGGFARNFRFHLLWEDPSRQVDGKIPLLRRSAV